MALLITMLPNMTYDKEVNYSKYVKVYGIPNAGTPLLLAQSRAQNRAQRHGTTQIKRTESASHAHNLLIHHPPHAGTGRTACQTNDTIIRVATPPLQIIRTTLPRLGHAGPRANKAICGEEWPLARFYSH